MLTLVICLVLVALSGAAVLHITLVDQTKGATPPRRRRLDADDLPGSPSGGLDAPTAGPEQDRATEPARAEPGPPRSASPPPVRRRPPPTLVVVETHRGRSAGLLALLLAVLGCLLALVVAVAAVVAVVALRAAVAG